MRNKLLMTAALLLGLLISGCGQRISDEDYLKITTEVKNKTLLKTMQSWTDAMSSSNPMAGLQQDPNRVYRWKMEILKEELKPYGYSMEDFLKKHEKMVGKENAYFKPE